MTTEVVIMNAQGVALAADSAVTLGGSKIFNTANKLYMLASDYPVGVLIYNNATFMNLPWEIIITAYKDYVLERKVRFEKLEQYGDDFVSFLKTNHEKFATGRQQELIVGQIAEGIFDEITKQIWERLEQIIFQTSSKIAENKLREEVKVAIDANFKSLKNRKDIYSPEEIDNIRGCLFENFGEIITNARKGLFDKLPLDEEDIEKLNKICVYLLTKDNVLPFHSGIVFVGYGETDLLPSCCAYIFESLVCGTIKCRPNEERSHKIDFGGSAAAVLPFAQDDMVQNFMLGAHPMLLEVLHDKLVDKLKMKEADANDFLSSVANEMIDNYTSSIILAVRALPKEDLAIMAETLVNLTSFMRKVSISLESVGGPVDVAVISKQDGFIWIKKKHYFDVQDNLHWHQTL